LDTYRAKPATVRAVRWVSGQTAPIDEILQVARDAGRIVDWEQSMNGVLVIKEKYEPDRVVISEKVGAEAAAQWVVVGGDGLITTMSDRSFRAWFEEDA
jgi:hypothetical protein